MIKFVLRGKHVHKPGQWLLFPHTDLVLASELQPFGARGGMLYREKRHNSLKKSGTRDDFTHLARNWGAMQLVM